MHRQPIGRPKRFCRQSCRQRAYEARRRSTELGLGDDELVVTRNELDDARDRLAEVTDALDDARTDLADGVAARTVLDRLIDTISSVTETN